MDQAQKRQFEDRLQRIAAGGPNTMAQVYVGPVDEAIVRPRKEAPVGNDILTNMQYPLSIIGASLVGAFAVFVSRYVRFHLAGGELTGENADLWMMVDGGVALAVVMALRSLFTFRGKAMETAKTVGIVAMIATMHNFVHAAPAPFAKVFSQEWVDDVVLMTEPKSILFRGISFVVGDVNPTKPEVAMPTILELDTPSFAGR